MKNGSDRHKRSTRGARSRSDILATAVDVFAELGPEATTMRLVARRAGVNIATLLYYFPSKDELFSELIGILDSGELAIVQTWRESITDQKLERLDILKESLVELGIMIIDRIIADPTRFRLGLYSALGASGQGPDTATAEKSSPEKSSPEKALVKAVLARAMELKTLHCDPDELDDYLEGYTYLTRGFAVAHIREICRGSEERDAVVRRFKKMVRRYIKTMLPGAAPGRRAEVNAQG